MDKPLYPPTPFPPPAWEIRGGGIEGFYDLPPSLNAPLIEPSKLVYNHLETSANRTQEEEG